MQKLYLDCDGVILDTINMSYKMLKEKGIEREEEKKQAEIEYAEEHGLNKGIKQTAKNLLSMDMKVEDISKATCLSIEEINNLK